MLYGWIEVGASNNGLFNGENNDDIIVRTIYNNKIILGNTNGQNQLAAMYIYGNNVGINKVPGSNIQLDVLGNAQMQTLKVGYSNFVGAFTMNGNVTLKDITKNYSSLSEVVISNSNDATYIYYGSNERIKFTDGNGMYITDTLYVTNDVYANAYQINSDRRLKTNIRKVDPEYDLNLLRNIDIYDFKMQSEMMRGVIAQDVLHVVPSSIKLKKGCVKLNAGLQGYVSHGCITIHGDISGLNVGDMIYVTSSLNTKHQVLCSIMSISQNKITISPPNEFIDNEHVLIDTKYVQDIHTVDYNQLVAVCINAVNALATRLENLEKYVYENKC